MCGISGFIDFNGNSSNEMLQRMSNVLSHRGPDSGAVEFLEFRKTQIGLGHRRLSIIDLSDAGKQPMKFEHLWIIYNGEIYNYKEIKNDLEKLGHSFIGHSDTEVILHAFAEWGIKCVDKFIGMFAIVIYDTKQQELICLRDRAGVKPLYYYWHNNLFLFGSELKSFHDHPDFKKQINADAVASYIQYGYVPAPHCIFEHCHKLLPGHFIKFDIQKATFHIEKYWDVYDSYNTPKLSISFQEAKIETEKLLKSAFDYRMVADVPVGVFLSGGYDSSCLAALLKQTENNQIKTFTIAVPDIGLNEAPFAKAIASHLGTNHHQYECTQKDALELVNDIPYYYDEPFSDSSAIPTMLVCKMAKQHISVALSADGGDEVFAGYNRYEYVLKYGNLLNKIPQGIKKSLLKSMEYIPANKIPFLRDQYNFSNRYEKLKGLLIDGSDKNRMLSLSKQYSDTQMNELFLKPHSILNTKHVSDSLKSEYYTTLSYMMAVDYQTYLPDDILQKVDRASMSVSLEAREPFLDHRIIEWAAQLPDHYKYANGKKKIMLKEIVHQYIPKTLMDRPKMGFAIPIDKWLQDVLKENVNYYLNFERITDQGIFNPFFVTQLKDDFFSGKNELAQKIWNLLSFQMWYDKWMK